MSSVFSTAYLGIGVPISASLAVVVLLAALVITRRLRRRYKNTHWAPVSATVEQADVARLCFGLGAVVFTPVIKYRYTYGEQQYLSSTISPDLHYAGSRVRSEALKLVALVPVGANVTAYVDQNNPHTAVLFRDFRYGWWYVLRVALAVFGGCNFLLLIIFAAVA